MKSKIVRYGNVIKIGPKSLYVSMTPEFDILGIKSSDKVLIELSGERITLMKA